MRTKEYLALKNFVHNEIGLSKEQLKQLLVLAVKEEAKAFVQKQFQNPMFKIQEISKNAISQEVSKILEGSCYETNANKLYQAIGQEIAKDFKKTS